MKIQKCGEKLGDFQFPFGILQNGGGVGDSNKCPMVVKFSKKWNLSPSPLQLGDGE